jgi:hypothetical protein
MVQAFCFVAIAGGLLALAVAWSRGRLLHTMQRTARLCGRPHETRAAIEASGEYNRFPYGPAIAIGCVLATFF